MIRTHASSVAPEWTVYRLSYSAVAGFQLHYHSPGHGVLKESVFNKQDADHGPCPALPALAVDRHHVLGVAGQPVVDLGTYFDLINLWIDLQK